MAICVQIVANLSGVLNGGWRCSQFEIYRQTLFCLCVYVTSHTGWGWQVMPRTTQARNIRPIDTKLIDCSEILIIFFLKAKSKWTKEVTKVWLFLTNATILSRTQSNGEIAPMSYRLSGVMAEVDLQICSLNCNGLNDDVKRNAVFSKLKRSATGIYLLQETHSTL